MPRKRNGTKNPPDPPFRGCWILANGRWSWHGANAFAVVATKYLAAGRSIACVPESSSRSGVGTEAGGLAFYAYEEG